MTRLLILPALVAAGVLTFAVVSGDAGTSGHGGKVVHVIEHATTDATTDTGLPGDSSGTCSRSPTTRTTRPTLQKWEPTSA